MIVFLHNHYQSGKRKKTCLSKMSCICLSFLLFQLKKIVIFLTENLQNQSTLLAFPCSFFIWLVYGCVCVAFQRTQKAFIWGRQLSDLHPPPPLSCTQERVCTCQRTRKSYEDHLFCCRRLWPTLFPLSNKTAVTFLRLYVLLRQHFSSPIFSSFGFRPNRMIFSVEYLYSAYKQQVMSHQRHHI